MPEETNVPIEQEQVEQSNPTTTLTYNKSQKPSILIKWGVVKTPMQAIYVWSGVLVILVMYTGHVLLTLVPTATVSPDEYARRASLPQGDALQHLAPKP